MTINVGVPLSPRETEVLWLIADGFSNKMIAAELGISDHTAKFHVHNAVNKMGTSSRTKAAVDFVLKNTAEARQRVISAVGSQLELRLPVAA